MTDIVEVADGQLIEPPLTVEQRLAEHCAWAEKDFSNGDYFHLLAKDAAALIASQAARIRELEGALMPFAAAFDQQEKVEELPDGSPVIVEHACGITLHELMDGAEGPHITYGHFRRARSLLSRKGGE